MGPRIDRWLLAGYVGVAGFAVLEGTVRPAEGAARTPTAEDQGTTRALVAGFIAAAVTAPLLQRAPLRPLPDAVRPLGVGLQGAGLALRAWSMQTLRSSYSRTLRVTNTQTVVESGPYRHIRNPGYLGSLLIWLGFALTSGSAAVVIAVATLLVPTYRRRIAIEEQLLTEELHGYGAYRRRTKRMIPALWSVVGLF